MYIRYKNQDKYLLFVNDVVIFGSDNIEEWNYLSNILRFFCNASGMEINVEKSSLFHINLSDSTQEELKNLLSSKWKKWRMDSSI